MSDTAGDIGAWVRPAESLSQTEADCPRNISAAGVSAQWSVARRETMLSE